jgi:hypothetical protein
MNQHTEIEAPVTLDDLTDIEEEIATLQSDILVIESQLEDDKSGDFPRDAEWRLRARSARLFKQRQMTNLRVDLKHFTALRGEQEATAKNKRHIQNQLAAQKNRYKAQIAVVQAKVDREVFARAAIVKWVGETMPEKLDEARAVRNAAQAKFDAMQNPSETK